MIESDQPSAKTNFKYSICYPDSGIKKSFFTWHINFNNQKSILVLCHKISLKRSKNFKRIFWLDNKVLENS